MMGSIDLTIFIPTAGRTAFLARLFASMDFHGDESVEVLVGYHGCEPTMVAFLAGLNLPKDRCRSYHLPRGGGIPANWNEGVRQARGRYIFLIGDDDEFAPGGWRLMLEAARVGGADVVAFGQQAIDVDGVPVEHMTRERSELLHERTESIHRINTAGAWPPPPIMSSMFSTAWLRTIPFRTEAAGAADIDLWLRAAVRGYTLRVSYECAIHYRVHAQSYTESHDLIGEALNVLDWNAEQAPPLAVQPYFCESLSRLWRGAINAALRSGDFTKAGKMLHEQGHQFVWHVRLRLWLKCRLRIREFKPQKYRSQGASNQGG